MPYDEAAPSVNSDEDAAERRQRFFDNQVCKETLQGHLERQPELSDVPMEDRSLAEMLIGQLDDNGYFTGSLPDIVMWASCSRFGKDRGLRNSWRRRCASR